MLFRMWKSIKVADGGEVHNSLFFLRLPIKFMSFIGVDVVIYLFANYQ